MNKYIISLLLLCSGCRGQYVSVSKVPIDKTSLASTYAETPDPKASKPPKGEKLYVSYRIPFGKQAQGAKLRLQLIYRNLDQEEVVFPLAHRMGTVGFEVVGEKFRKTNGVFSYKAQLIGSEGEVVDTYTQRMWVNVIKVSTQK